MYTNTRAGKRKASQLMGKPRPEQKYYYILCCKLRDESIRRRSDGGYMEVSMCHQKFRGTLELNGQEKTIGAIHSELKCKKNCNLWTALTQRVF